MTEHPQDFEALKREAERVAKELDIPPCPAILSKFNQEFNSRHPDLRRMAALIGSDIGLSAMVLKTVNSPFYGLTNKATSVDKALSILGLRASANLVSGLLLRRAFPASAGGTIERFWDRSTRIAVLAAWLATRMKDLNPSETHTYVLFRDCGMLVMLRKFPQYAEIIEQSASIPGMQLARAEDARFGFNHARVAAALARSWSLPDPLSAAIACHHDFALRQTHAPTIGPPDPKLVAFGLLAEQVFALQINQGLCPDWAGAEYFVLSTLGIDADDIVSLTEDLPALAA